jgi:hypothetical protein
MAIMESSKMQYLGCIDNPERARIEARKASRINQRTVVLEKAKRKEGTHRYTTYRAWLDCELQVVQVISLEQWKENYHKGEN